MFEELDHALEQLLQNELDLDADGIEVSFSQPNGQWVARRSGPALNFFLYDVRENPTLRRHQWQQEPEPRGRTARTGGAGTVALRRTPLMLDCFYMVTAWSGAEERVRPFQEHDLLGRALRALARYPILNPPFEELERFGALAGADRRDASTQGRVRMEPPVSGQMTNEQDMRRRAWLGDRDRNPLAGVEVEIRTRIAHHDVLTNPAEVWSALEAQMKAGFSYVVTLPLDPWSSVEAYQVMQRKLQISPTTWDAKKRALQPIEPAAGDELYTISGTIRDTDGVPQVAALLQLLHGPAADHASSEKFAPEKEDAQHRYIAETGPDGRYRFANLLPGTYTLLICLKSSKEMAVREFLLSPAGPTGYDFTL